MLHNPLMLHTLLNHLTEALIVYASYQIESGAQVMLKSVFAVAPPV
jgi:uroporphyrinogen-III decarboxylase